MPLATQRPPPDWFHCSASSCKQNRNCYIRSYWALVRSEPYAVKRKSSPLDNEDAKIWGKNVDKWIATLCDRKSIQWAENGPKAKIRQMICLLASAEFAKWKSQNRKGVQNCGTHTCYTKNPDRPSDSDSGEQLSRPSILFAEAPPRSASKSLPKIFKYTKYPTCYTGETAAVAPVFAAPSYCASFSTYLHG